MILSNALLILPGVLIIIYSTQLPPNCQTQHWNPNRQNAKQTACSPAPSTDGTRNIEDVISIIDLWPDARLKEAIIIIVLRHQ